MPAERIVPAFDLQLFDLQLGAFQIHFRCETVDLGFEEREGGAFNRETSTKLAIAGVHCSLDCDLPGKIAGICAEQSDEIAKLIDGSRNIAAKVRAKPAGRVRGEFSFAA